MVDVSNHRGDRPAAARGPARRAPIALPAALALVACLLSLTWACTPAEQALAERRALETSRRAQQHLSAGGQQLSAEAQRLLRQLERSYRLWSARAAEQGARLREHHETAQALAQNLLPPPGSAPIAADPEAITCDGDTCSIDQAVLEAILAEPARILHEGAVIPALSGAEIVGFRLIRLRAGGLAERIGLASGDVLRAIDDAPIATIPHDPSLQRRLLHQRSWTLHLRRGGQEFHRTVSLR